ncbi:unnamed protein product [Vitrella brassicaformis CCMP3155]|uniref:Enkurin domain-containing protein n=2 Tax=Vitrella brassicaformis TaxID=1169539 RepID=A0A0G4H4W7_VITBC|nr:unnamed protein product [Vitrella brassicaformis CCMP3155]|eukprot:CEM38828.1 unnamed protein product [Vitrella brassicaformis CCMP3155]
MHDVTSASLLLLSFIAGISLADGSAASLHPRRPSSFLQPLPPCCQQRLRLTTTRLHAEERPRARKKVDSAYYLPSDPGQFVKSVDSKRVKRKPKLESAWDEPEPAYAEEQEPQEEWPPATATRPPPSPQAAEPAEKKKPLMTIFGVDLSVPSVRAASSRGRQVREAIETLPATPSTPTAPIPPAPPTPPARPTPPVPPLRRIAPTTPREPGDQYYQETVPRAAPDAFVTKRRRPPADITFERYVAFSEEDAEIAELEAEVSGLQRELSSINAAAAENMKLKAEPGFYFNVEYLKEEIDIKKELLKALKKKKDERAFEVGRIAKRHRDKVDFLMRTEEIRIKRGRF